MGWTDSPSLDISPSSFVSIVLSHRFLIFLLIFFRKKGFYFLPSTKQNLSEIDVSVKTVLADAGYCSNDNLEYLESKDEIEGLVSTRKEQEM